MTADFPLVLELRPPPDIESALLQFAAQPHSLFLDSAARDVRLGRYSFLTADPFDFFTVAVDKAEGLELLSSRLKRWQSPALPDLPPFQGGAAGLLAYDLSRSLERIDPPHYDEFQLPAMAIGLYDIVLA